MINTKGHIDVVEIFADVLRISGWTASLDHEPPKAFEVYSGEIIFPEIECISGLDSPDVKKTYPALVGADHCRFMLSIPLTDNAANRLCKSAIQVIPYFGERRGRALFGRPNNCEFQPPSKEDVEYADGNLGAGVEINVDFTGHNIRLDDGTFTIPGTEYPMENYPFFVSARGILNAVFPGDKSRFRLADLGCLEGGYAVEFARMGFQVLGLEIRESNIAACHYVKANTNLPQLAFVRDNAWNILNHGTFDAVFCCGLLYHFEEPMRFLEILGEAANRIVIIQTHFSLKETRSDKYVLSEITENESLRGRWYTEFGSNEAYHDRANSKWSSWDNRRSFWIQREYLIQAIYDVGFDLVLEQFDCLAPNIADAMTHGQYMHESRGTFIGIKTQGAAGNYS